MHIECIEVQNFRKLKSIRVDFTLNTTVLVGANNSGKTAAMVALGHFLVDKARFSTNDFTLSNWAGINKIGDAWESQIADQAVVALSASEWDDLLPAMDVWLSVAANEVHYVNHLVPTLDWAGGLLGVRLRYEPKDIAELSKDYSAAAKAAKDTKAAAAKKSGSDYKVALWPTSLEDFLKNRLGRYFEIHAYVLDPAKRKEPKDGIAHPQTLPGGSEPIEGDPLKGLIRINGIDAQRGFSDVSNRRALASPETTESRSRRETRKLSDQLRAYYTAHLNPTEHPEPEDLEALQAIAQAQASFDGRLKSGFAAALGEVEDLGYPGVTDPKLIVSTKLHPVDGLDHDAAVQYEVASKTVALGATSLRLPEEYNGLGYQNLISMIFKLMSFRDGWMQVGKAAKKPLADGEKPFPPPLHLVLVEEPEAHLHAQVQQVFIRKAYKVLRKHPDLGDKENLRTQLIISTHSGHIAHESKFSSLRYFRRMPAEAVGSVPRTAVVNLSEVFGKADETQQFVTRYLKATHCDLFFADAAILVEGPAERMLVPHFIHNQFKFLSHRYLTLLEINGSHAHRLRPLIEHLGLPTLIITDIDAAEAAGRHPATPPARGKGQITRNSTLKTWIPEKNLIDDLLAVVPSDKVKKYDELFSVRVAYQIPLAVQVEGKAGTSEALPNTFEDALVFDNLATFKVLDGDGLIGDFKEATNKSPEPKDLSPKIFELLKSGEKAKFALDLLFGLEPKKLNVPTYIKEGLVWLEEQLRRRQLDVLDSAAAAATAAVAPPAKVAGVGGS